MNKKNILIMFIILLIIPLCSAVAPITTIYQGETGLQIEINTFASYQQGEARFNSIYIFNSSNGNQLTPTNSDITCKLNLKDSQGFHITNVTATPHEDHWDINGTAGANQTEGVYGYLIYCVDSTTNQGGYKDGIFEILNKGSVEPKNINPIILLIGLGIFAIILFLINTLLSKEHELFKLVILIFIPLILLLITHTVHQFFLFSLFETVASNFLKLSLWFIYLYYIYFFLYIFYTIFNYFKRNK